MLLLVWDSFKCYASYCFSDADVCEQSRAICYVYTHPHYRLWNAKKLFIAFCIYYFLGIPETHISFVFLRLVDTCFSPPQKINKQHLMEESLGLLSHVRTSVIRGLGLLWNQNPFQERRMRLSMDSAAVLSKGVHTPS
jgi:hypothetical protein